MPRKNATQSTLPPNLLRSCQVLADKKADEIVILDVKGISSITDYYIVASGDSPPQLKAMADAAQAALREQKEATGVVDGDPMSGWVVMDAYEFIIHLFRRDVRGTYALESLWKDRPKIVFQDPTVPLVFEEPKPARKRVSRKDPTVPPASEEPKPVRKRVSRKKTPAPPEA